MKRLLFAAAIIFAHSSSFAQMYNGQDLAKFASAYERSKEKRASGGDWSDSSLFLGYVAGINDTTLYRTYCPPSNVTLGQLSSIAAAFLKNHPEKWAYAGSEVVKQSFEQAFPCPKSQK